MKLGVSAEAPEQEAQAAALAARLELPLVPLMAEGYGALLVRTSEWLELRERGEGAAGAVYVDFTSGKAAHRRRFGGGKGQALLRAVGLKGSTVPTVLDATAGLGQDSFVIATYGCSVQLVERSKVVAALLEDALTRAATDTEVGEIVARMRLTVGNAAEVMAALPETARPDTVYLDPMYPHSGKSALKGKEMRLFRDLVGDDPDTPELLKAALECARKRVTVKRPLKAPPVAGFKVSAVIEEKTTRFDLYF